MTLLSLEPFTLFYYITWVCDLCDSDHAVAVTDVWPLSYVFVTCDIMFCLLCLSSNKEKENRNSK